MKWFESVHKYPAYSFLRVCFDPGTEAIGSEEIEGPGVLVRAR